MTKIMNLITELTDYVYKEIEDLRDKDYMKVLQDLASQFQSSVDAKQEEIDNG